MEYEASPTPPDPKKLDKLSAEALGGYELALAGKQRLRACSAREEEGYINDIHALSATSLVEGNARCKGFLLQVLIPKWIACMLIDHGPHPSPWSMVHHCTKECHV